MFDEEYHLTILKFSSIYAIRIYEIVSADRFFQRDVNPEYEIDDLRYWLDCEKKYKKTNDFYKYVIETAVRDHPNDNPTSGKGTLAPVFYRKPCLQEEIVIYCS